MKNILMLLMSLLAFPAMSQTKTYIISNDPDGGSLIYNGKITFSDLDKEPTFTWLKKGRDAYKPDEGQLKYLQQHLKDYSMVVFMGTWCDDSHELIPKLEQLLQMTGFPAASVTMYATDHAKKTKGGEDKQYNITLVPTVIIIANGKEVGRITESVEKSIDADLAAIIRKQRGDR